jgi:DNA-binding winged helix-turn-helix (wHTH) protein
MNAEISSTRAVRFADFELDLRRRELRKGGLRLNLETKPFQVLELLVENADRLVTRKELRERLWPNTFVEFDRGIYTAMNNLRKVLGDTGDTKDSPRYIETRSRLGYRFVAPVSPALVSAQSVLWPLSGDAKLAVRPSLIGLSVQRSPAFAATTNPRFDGGALRLQVRHPGGELAEFVLRLTATEEGSLNMRIDSGGAGLAEARTIPGSVREAGPNSTRRRGYSEMSSRRGRR